MLIPILATSFLLHDDIRFSLLTRNSHELHNFPRRRSLGSKCRTIDNLIDNLGDQTTSYTIVIVLNFGRSPNFGLNSSFARINAAFCGDNGILSDWELKHSMFFNRTHMNTVNVYL